MKALLLIVIFFVSSYSYAQSAKKHWVYVSVDLIIGNYYGIGSSLNYIRNEKLSLAIVGFGSRKEAANKPADYSGGWFSLGRPHDSFSSYHLLLGRVFKLTDNARFNLSGGIGYATFNEPVNWRSGSSGWFGPNYTYDFNKFHNLCLIIQPKLEMGSANGGFGLSGLLVFTETRNLFGITISGLLGKAGERRIKKDKSKDEKPLIKNSNDESELNEN